MENWLAMPGKSILLHNRRGLRIEWNLQSEGFLEIWTSPLAGRSARHSDRNFSNRDDHVRVFDQVKIFGVSGKTLRKADYDPYESALSFRDGLKLSLLSLVSEPVVVLTASKSVTLELKTDMRDRVTSRSGKELVVEQENRGRQLQFAAVVRAARKGSGFQRVGDMPEKRSVYFELVMGRGDALVIAGGDKSERPAGTARSIARRIGEKGLGELRGSNEGLITRMLAPGKLSYRKKGRGQDLLDFNRRIMSSLEDDSGAIQACLTRIYYMIWIRDGAVAQASQAMAGNPGPLERWCRYLLENPNVIWSEKPRGRTFSMLVGGSPNKWEEDGVFYAIWSAFTHWTQTGDSRFVTGDCFQLLADAMNWLERYCLDRALGLFGRFYFCETPFPGSRDHGYDNAVGFKTPAGEKIHHGHKVRRSYDLYINAFAYASYRMLAAMAIEAGSRKSSGYLTKARRLAAKLEDFFRYGDLPAYGPFADDQSALHWAEPYGLDDTDYLWGLSLIPFDPFHASRPGALSKARLTAFRDVQSKPENTFLAAFFPLLSCLHPLDAPEAERVRALRTGEKECHRKSELLLMDRSMTEIVGRGDRNGLPVNRPQMFSIGPYLYAAASLGVRRLPFGLAVQPSGELREVRDYRYRGSHLDLSFGDTKGELKVSLDGKLVCHSLQIPEERLRPGKQALHVQGSLRQTPSPLLIDSDVRLLSIQTTGKAVLYGIEAYGEARLCFSGSPSATEVRDARGRPTDQARHADGGKTWLTFRGTGRFVVSAEAEPV